MTLNDGAQRHHYSTFDVHSVRAFQIHAVTDITGFGLAGHALEMARASGVCMQIEINALPVMDQALAMYRKGMNTGVNIFNRQLVIDHTTFQQQWPQWYEQILYDPQTSGDLLVALPEKQGQNLIHTLQSANTPAAAIIGHVRNRVQNKNDTTHLVIQ